jgi:hypothetical protein
MADDTKIGFDPSALVDGIADANALVLDLQRRVDALAFTLTAVFVILVGLYVVRR